MTGHCSTSCDTVASDAPMQTIMQPATPSQQGISLPIIPSQHQGNVTFWMFPPDISQATIFGRTGGSNACTFIALMTGSTYVANASALHLPDSGDLPNTWFVVLAQSMVSGNQIYDHIIQNTPSLFGVHDAVTLVQHRTRISQVSVEHQCDFEAPQPGARLSNLLKTLDNTSAALNIVSSQTTLYMKSNTEYIFFDSHMHSNGLQVAVLAKVKHSYIDDLVSWVRHVNRMRITLGTVTIVKF